MRWSQFGYGVMQIAIVGFFIWVGIEEAPDIQPAASVIIGVFFALLATACVYWANRGVRRLLGLGNAPHPEPTFTHRVIDLGRFSPTNRQRRIDKGRR